MKKTKYGEKTILESGLEIWENSFSDRDYKIHIEFSEFTCLCPHSGYPDFATIKITYIPDRYVIELKSLKLFLNKYRERYISHEDATNEIFNALYDILKPRHLQVIGDFNPRGNVKTIVEVNSEVLKKKDENC
ncbi:MAG: NADPH-dependent 7-cyano-7-deazaguanine reductase QueF [Deltaproteobacteria bacterium]|nr:NADPH-dependent 7-cyano-7-deazaguanine reductase QueF [Deltaproteobacteria bacterium]